jgi:hypothetical protein
MRTIRSAAPLLAAGVVLWVVLCGLLWASLARTGGTLVYALDDAYIHMAMAGNLARDGVFGVTRHEYSSSSSSPLWTLLLGASFRAAGVRAWIPLALNTMLATLVLVAVWRSLAGVAAASVAGACPDAGTAPPPAAALALLVAAALAIPLPALVFGGQEHVLHALLSISFVRACALALAAVPTGRGWAAPAVLLAALLTGARYEGAFLIAAAALRLSLGGRRGLAWAVAAAGLVPIVAYGCVSLSHGWFFLPNPILLKANLSDVAGVRALVARALGRPGDGSAGDLARLMGLTAAEQLARVPELWALLAGAAGALAAAARRPAWLARTDVEPVWMFALAAVLHLQFARTGWFFRYEAYLVALGITALARPVLALPRRALPLALALFACTLAPRAAQAIAGVPRAVSNIHDQQYQMGRFLARHYPDAEVAANDIGAINFLSDVRCLDLYGLADLTVCRLRMDLAYEKGWIDRLTRGRGTRVALVYDEWFDEASTGGLPGSWRCVGRWTIRDCYVNAHATVAIYAVRPGEETELARRLAQFAPELPAAVVQGGPYTRLVSPRAAPSHGPRAPGRPATPVSGR